MNTNFLCWTPAKKKRQTKKQGQTVSFCGTASRVYQSEMHWISHARKRRNQFSKTIKFLLISLEILTQINLEYFTYCIFLGKKKKGKKKKASLLKQTSFKLRNRNILFKNTLALWYFPGLLLYSTDQGLFFPKKLVVVLIQREIVTYSHQQLRSTDQTDILGWC